MDTDKDHLAAARQFIDQRNYVPATIELKALLGKTPNAPEARYLLGLTLMQQGLVGQALTEFNKAADLGYDKDQLVAKRASALLANQRFQDLLREYSDVTLADRHAQAELRTAIAAAHLRYQRVKEAEAALNEALEAQPNYGWALLNKARIAIHRGQTDEAFKLVDTAIGAGTINGEAWHMKAALLLVVKGDLVAAEQAYKESAKDPRFAELARADLISLYFRQNRVQDIRPLFEEMKKANPQHPTTLFVEAQVAHLEGQYDKANEILARLLKFNPEDPRLLLLAGATDLRRGALMSAQTHLGKAMQLTERQPAARQLLAGTYLRLNQPEKALTALRPLLDATSPDGNALALAGEAYLRLGDFDRAEAHFTAALKRTPGDVRLRTATALTDLVRGDTQSGLRTLEQLASTDKSDIADKALISAYLKRRNFEAALTAIDRLARKKPEEAGVHLLRGMALLGKGDPSAARGAFEGALKIDPGNGIALAQLAGLDLQAGKPEVATQRLVSAIKAYPKDTSLRLTFLGILSRTGAPPAKSKAFLIESVAAVPGDPSLQVALVDFLLAQGETQAALAAARQALSAFGDNARVLDAAGRALAESGDEQQAISVFGRAAGLAPRDPLPHIRLADIYGKRKDMAAAAASLKRAFDLAPMDDGVHRRMLSLAKLTNDPSVALAAAKTLQKLHPDKVTGYFIEGDVQAARKNWPVAIAAFSAAIGKPGADSAAQIRVHDATLASGQQAAAERFAADWIKNHPQDARFIEHMADIAMRRHAYPAAEDLLNQALRADPRSAVAYNNLAWVQLERGAKEALANAEKAYSLAPASPAVMDTLAKTLAAQRDFKRAIDIQQKAVDTGGPDAGLYRLHLAQILATAGDKPKALAELDQLAKLGDRFAGQKAVAALQKSLQAP